MTSFDSASGARLEVDLDAERGRYHRQTLIRWWRQERLASARVLVVGAGAIGNEIVKNLALAGVGSTVVIDLDRVEHSNLSRCVFFRPSDEGRPKAVVVCERASELNGEVTFTPIVGDVRYDIGLADFAEFDVVIGGLDNREARLHVNECCWKASTPWIDGAIEGLMGVMRVFIPPDSACYECTMSEQDRKLLAARRACSLLSHADMLSGKVPTTGTSGSVIAALQVQEAIKLLHRDKLRYDFAGRGFAFNGVTHDSYVVTYKRREDCQSHDTFDLADAPRLSGDVPLGEILAQGREALGDPDAVLELHEEVVLATTCPSCDTTTPLGVILPRLNAEEGRCRACRETCQLSFAHSVEAGHELLDRTAADLGLPAQHVVTVRGRERRRHYVLTAPGDGEGSA